MSRETDWHVFDKAAEITASAVRGTAGGENAPGFAAEVFREVHRALAEAAEQMSSNEAKTGF
jgi:hypothetical protein